jgi:hypothetical protein
VIVKFGRNLRSAKARADSQVILGILAIVPEIMADIRHRLMYPFVFFAWFIRNRENYALFMPVRLESPAPWRLLAEIAVLETNWIVKEAGSELGCRDSD